MEQKFTVSDFMILLGLMLLITINDIIRMIKT